MRGLLDKMFEHVDTTSDMENHFEDRTNMHIRLVQEAIEKIVVSNPEFREFDEHELVERGKVHDASKFYGKEHEPYVFLSWKKKCSQDGTEYEYPEGMEEQVTAATISHVLNNSHHPEYHLENKDDVSINAKDRDKSDRCMDASRMPAIDVAEMVADWQAMSEELGTNTAREWYNEQKDVRWHFTAEQDDLINRLLGVLEV